MICSRCRNKIPDGNLACPDCIQALSDQIYSERQRNFIPEIVSNKRELTIVYIPAGHGPAGALWHLRRYGEPPATEGKKSFTRGFCNAKLPSGSSTDNLKYEAIHTIRKFCPGCESTLAALVTEHLNAVPA
jgi:hypothetical protein